MEKQPPQIACICLAVPKDSIEYIGVASVSSQCSVIFPAWINAKGKWHIFLIPYKHLFIAEWMGSTKKQNKTEQNHRESNWDLTMSAVLDFPPTGQLYG